MEVKREASRSCWVSYRTVGNRCSRGGANTSTVCGKRTTHRTAGGRDLGQAGAAAGGNATRNNTESHDSVLGVPRKFHATITDEQALKLKLVMVQEAAEMVGRLRDNK